MSISTILPLISAIFIFFLGIFVLLKNRNSQLNIIFTLLSLSLIFWFFGTFMMFNSKENAWAVFWDRFVYMGVVFIPILMYHFSLVFSKIKDKKLLFLGYILSFIFLLLSRTNYFVSDLYRYSWGYHTQARFFHHIFLVFFSVYLTLFYANIYKYYREAKLNLERTRAKYIFLSFLVLLTGSISYLPAYGIDIFPSAYISGLIFAVILAYTIVKYQLMDVKVILTEFLVSIISLLLFIEAVISQNLNEQLLRWGTFLIFLIFGYLLIKSVLNEIKRREQLEKLTIELEKTYEKLKIVNDAKSEFVSIASHQLRTPLTAIKGYISMIIEGAYGKLPQEIIKPLENVYKSNEELINLVNDLLNLSRLEAGKIQFEPTSISLEKMIDEIIGTLKINADKKGLYIKFTKPNESAPDMMIDEPKLKQVILNIIDNAIKYTTEGGIAVELKIDPPTGGDKLKISIKDTGAGIAKEEIKDLFQMFSRASAGNRLHTGGSGVGLHVAKKFIEMHHGRIWAESEGEGKGSVFYIELPIK